MRAMPFKKSPDDSWRSPLAFLAVEPRLFYEPSALTPFRHVRAALTKS